MKRTATALCIDILKNKTFAKFICTSPHPFNLTDISGKCVAEFLKMKSIKTYLHSSVNQVRLVGLATISV